MKQFENYISRMSFDGVESAIIMPYTEYFYNIIPLLKKYTNVENIYCMLPSRTTLTKSHSMLYSYKVEICNIFDVMERSLSVDMLLLDYNRAEDIENLTGHPVKYIIGRMGIPYRQKGISIISIAVDAPQDVISALSGSIGRIDGISAKTAYSNCIFKGNQ